MNQLHLFACSHGKFGTTEHTNYPDWKNEGSFGESLANRLGLEFINKSRPGACNYHLFKRIMSNHFNQQFKKDDIVLVQWPSIGRAFHTDETKTVMPSMKEFEDYYINYYDDLQSLCNVLTFNCYIKNKINCKYFFSFADSIETIENIEPVIVKEFIDDSSFLHYNRMTPLEYIHSLNESKYYLKCKHLSLIGHQKISDIYFELINSKI